MRRRSTADKREIKDFLKFPAYFIRKKLSKMAMSKINSSSLYIMALSIGLSLVLSTKQE